MQARVSRPNVLAPAPPTPTLRAPASPQNLSGHQLAANAHWTAHQCISERLGAAIQTSFGASMPGTQFRTAITACELPPPSNHAEDAYHPEWLAHATFAQDPPSALHQTPSCCLLRELLFHMHMSRLSRVSGSLGDQGELVNTLLHCPPTAQWHLVSILTCPCVPSLGTRLVPNTSGYSSPLAPRCYPLCVR